MNEYIRILVIVCPLVFIAGFVDSIAGGGGIISLPAYLFAGLPVHIAVATNKFAMSFGTTMSARNFIKAKKVNYKVAMLSIIGAFAGSSIGSSIALYISDHLLKLLLIIILPMVAIFLVTNKRIFKEEETKAITSSKRFHIFSLTIGFFIGMYDGLIGPGTGTFLIIAFMSILSLDIITASGCAKISNLASNIAALMVFILGKKVSYIIGIPAAICAMLGCFIGSKVAIKGGERYIRPVIFIVIALLFVKTVYELFI